MQIIQTCSWAGLTANIVPSGCLSIASLNRYCPLVAKFPISICATEIKVIFSQKCYTFFRNENTCVSHLTRVDGVENPANNFYLDPVTLTFDTEFCNLWLWPLRHWPSLESRWKIELLHFYPSGYYDHLIRFSEENGKTSRNQLIQIIKSRSLEIS